MIDYDDDISPEARIFSFRADAIQQTKLEGYERIFNNKFLGEKEADVEENELMENIKEKLKKRPRRKKAINSVKEIPVATPPKVEKRGRKKKLMAEDKVQTPGSGINDKDSASPAHLPQTAKKRIRNLQLKTSREKKRVDEEYKRILVTCKNTVPEEVNFGENIASSIKLKVRYMSDIHKICVGMNEQFVTIFPKVADLCKLNASEMLLCIQDQNIELKDTPQSLNLKYFNILDCIPYKPIENKTAEKDESRFLLKMQSNDSKKAVDIYTHELEKFRNIMQRYSELCEIPLTDLTFEFDGEKLDESETPGDLEMESGSCIDVKISDRFKKADSPDIEIINISTKPIPKSEMLQICVLD